MKKNIIILIAAVFILGISLSSCRSNKPPCPAYSSNIEYFDVNNNANV